MGRVLRLTSRNARSIKLVVLKRLHSLEFLMAKEAQQLIEVFL